MVGLGERKRVVTYDFGDGDGAGGGCYMGSDGNSGDLYGVHLDTVDTAVVDYGAGLYGCAGTGRGVGRPTCSESCRGHG